MEFANQLKLLLWKNLTLKRRKLWALLIEINIPLVMFIILIGIRHKVPKKPCDAKSFPAKALPSSGIFRVLQQFCEGEQRDKNNFLKYPNSEKTYDFLLNLQLAATNTLVFSRSFDEQEFSKLPSYYKSIIDDPASLHGDYLRLTNMSVWDFLYSKDLLTKEIEDILWGSNNSWSASPQWRSGHSFKSKRSVDILENPRPIVNFSFIDLAGSNLSALENHTIAISLLRHVLTSPMALKLLLCDANVGGFQSSVNKFICQLTVSEPQLLSSIFDAVINESALYDIFEVNRWNLTATYIRLSQFVYDLKAYTELELALRQITHFAELFPLETCETVMNSTNGTTSSDSNESPDVALYPRLARTWNYLQTYICGFNGTEARIRSEQNGYGSGGYDSYGISDKQKEEFSILFHMLFMNPKVLYSPNVTSVERIMKKANKTFAVISQVSEYVANWSAVSTKLRHFMASARFSRDLVELHRIKADLSKDSIFSYALLTYAPELKSFRDEATIPSQEVFLSQLDAIDNMACSWLSFTNNTSFNMFKGFATEEELVDYVLNHAYKDNSTVIAGVVFTNINANGSLPRHIVYKIRQNASFVPNTRQIRDRYWMPGPRDFDYFYYEFGFVWMQDIVERAMIDEVVGSDVVEPGTYVHQHPYPCFLYDLFFVTCKHMLPMCIVLSWVYPVAMLVQNIVYEKEARLKVVMKTMGLESSVHWFAWFVTSFTQMSVTAGILTLMLRFGFVLPYADPLLIFIALELFAVSSIMFSFLISVIYSKAKLAAACAGILYFLSYVPCLYVSIRETTTGEHISSFTKLVISFFSTSAFGLGAKYIAFYEEEAVGVSWRNFNVSPVEGDSYSLLQVMGMLVADSILYGLLTWYIENVHPGSYGLPRPWYFPFTFSYWRGYNKSDDSRVCCSALIQQLWPRRGLSVQEDDQRQLLHDHVSVRDWLEPEPSNLPKRVLITNLTKKYRKATRFSLNHLNLALFEGQITALLGHNGAGKTTTMYILTGLFPPTDGSATIYGMDIRTDIDAIRKSMGMCPQHNVLFDQLTVEEHLWFYGSLKSTGAKGLKEEIRQMIEDVGLTAKRHSLVESLSGGMKRLLSVAIAFVSGSRMVVLDEPTAGVDPSARRAIWDLLIKYKVGRTILLSTHHLEEADIIGDRIAIIADGELICSGSAVFLKKVFGDGYLLTVVKRPDDVDDNLLDLSESSVTDDSGLVDSSPVRGVCIPDRILRLLQQYFPGAYLKQETLWEAEFVLPAHDSRNFKDMLDHLDANMQNLWIQSYGIRDTTLEEVFLKVTKSSIRWREAGEGDGRSEEEAEQSMQMQSLRITPAGAELVSSEAPTHRPSQPMSAQRRTQCAPDAAYEVLANRKQLYWTLFITGMTKRFHYIRRNWKAISSQILLPSVFVCIAMTVALAAPRAEDMPPLVLSPAQYFNLTQPTGNFIPVSVLQPTVQRYANGEAGPSMLNSSLYLPSGISATCLLRPDVVEHGDFSSPNTINSSLFHRLLFRYFIAGCESVFIPGLPLQNFVSPLPGDTLVGAKDNTSDTTLHPATGLRYYPQCTCRSDGRGFICASNYKKPPMQQLVTRDYILDISGSNMADYLLYTQPIYWLNRYGGLEFGHEIDAVPPSFGVGMPSFFRRLAVRRVSKAWFYHKGYHSMPIYLNAINNALLRANLMLNSSAKPFAPASYGFTLINHPFNKTQGHFDIEFTKSGGDAIIAMFIIIAMSFVPASFIVFLVYERANGAKHLQFLAGMHPVVYWVTNFVWDLCNYSIPMVCILIILKAFDLPAYMSPSNFPATFVLFLLYGWSITAMMYPASFYFNEPSSAYICLIVLNLFTGITCILTSSLLELFHLQSANTLKSANDVFKMIFLIFPNYCLGRGLMDLALTEQQNEWLLLTGQSSDKLKSPFAMDVTLRSLIAMAIEGFVFFLITLCFEYGFSLKKKRVRHSPPRRLSLVAAEDADVATERNRVLSGLARHEQLGVVNLTKIYKSRKHGSHLAVSNLCFSVPKGECFGLLGVNGAGKTTTFRILTGDMEPTYGDVLLQGRPSRHLCAARKNIGYCPQFDALFDELTAREHLIMYVRIHGIAARSAPPLVDALLHKLDLVKYADQPVGTYSGGTKRKLSVAIALVGEPDVIFMDEPTTGMDPYSRRFLWDVIAHLVDTGRSVVLTSHSIEECEVLCTRLAIMVNGTLRCIGSVQHLKNRFGDGYSIKFRFVSAAALAAAVDRLLAVFRAALPSVTLKEHHNNILHLEVASNQLKLSKLFATARHVRRAFCNQIVDYSIAQKSLENVFLSFAKLQTEFLQVDSLQADDEPLISGPLRADPERSDSDASLLSDDSLLYDFDGT